jgi:hypothetical protein
VAFFIAMRYRVEALFCVLRGGHSPGIDLHVKGDFLSAAFHSAVVLRIVTLGKSLGAEIGAEKFPEYLEDDGIRHDHSAKMPGISGVHQGQEVS